MLPEPIVGKHYNLRHRDTKSNPFRGPVLIIQKGQLRGKKIFRTVVTQNEWHYWDDYDTEYIGDLA